MTALQGFPPSLILHLKKASKRKRFKREVMCPGTALMVDTRPK
jgi:hypothetical protein